MARGRPLSFDDVIDLLVDVRVILGVATMLIVATLLWALRQNYNVLLSYADAPTHLNLARRVHDDLHPGLGQLGDYWLPLAHVIELPFVWNDALWKSGLAGAIPNIGCYLLSVWCLYQLTIIATRERFPAAIAALAFAANPNILYLHIIPMFEPSIIASMLGATYLLARWLQSSHTRMAMVAGRQFDRSLLLLIATGAAMSVASTSRYENWGFVVASALVVAIALWQRGDRGARFRGRLLFYLIMAWYGMALWIIWNLSLSGDPIYFLHPSFNQGLAEDRLAILTKHNVLSSTAYVIYSIGDNAGPALIVLGAVGLWRFAVAFGLRARGLWMYLLATPAAFDIFYLWFKGTPPILVPQLIPHNSGNIRYGVVTLPFLCLLLAYLARRPTISIWGVPALRRTLVVVRRMLPAIWPVIQLGILLIALGQPLILIKRDYVVSYNEANTADYRASQYVRHVVAVWLGAHYDRGLILMSTFKGADRIILDSGLPDDTFVHEGSQNTWKCALADPQKWVRWIVLFKRGDGAKQLLNTRYLAERRYFSLVHDAGGDAGYWIFKRNERPWHPVHPKGCA